MGKKLSLTDCIKCGPLSQFVNSWWFGGCDYFPFLEILVVSLLFRDVSCQAANEPRDCLLRAVAVLVSGQAGG